jgi:hypothetical protein
MATYFALLSPKRPLSAVEARLLDKKRFPPDAQCAARRTTNPREAAQAWEAWAVDPHPCPSGPSGRTISYQVNALRLLRQSR